MKRKTFQAIVFTSLIAFVLFGYNNCGVPNKSALQNEDGLVEGSTTVANPGDPVGVPQLICQDCSSSNLTQMRARDSAMEVEVSNSLWADCSRGMNEAEASSFDVRWTNALDFTFSIVQKIEACAKVIIHD